MSILLTFNGSNYIIPQTNEIGWGSNLDAYFVAIPAGCLQKTGGSFTLSAETDFGASFGLKSAYLKSRASAPASGGILRLGNNEAVTWRNFANGGDLPLLVNAADQLTFNGNVLAYSSGSTLTANRAIISNGSGLLAASAVTNTELGYVGGVTSGIQGQLDAKVDENAPITPATKTKITYDAKGLVTVGADANLDDLGDVIIATPTIDQILRYNGSQWVNAQPADVSAGSGIVEYFIDTPTAAGNFLLSPAPSGTETIDTIAVTAATSPVLIEGYLTSGFGRTQLDAGLWDIDIYRYISTVSGTNTFIIQILREFLGAGTITLTGGGPSRTATVTGGTPFLAGDANANKSLAGKIQTPTQTFDITGFTSSSVVTVATPVGYTNESSVAYSVQRHMFNVSSAAVTDTSVALENILTVQPAYTGWNLTDELAIRIYGNTTGAGSINFSFVHGGTAHYSHVHTPLITRHNDLAGLQGGSAGQEYHLSQSEHTVATQAASGSQNGYLTSTDWTTFNNKQDLISFLPVAQGGTGVNSFIPYSLVCGGTTSGGVLQSVANVGLLGQFLQSQGPGALPQWANIAGTGTVNSATQYQMTYYAATGNTVSGTSSITTNASGQLLISNGSVSNPGIAFSTDAGLGIFKSNPLVMDFASNGATRFQVYSLYLNALVPLYIPDGNAGGPGLAFGLDTNSGIFRNGTDQFSLVTNGTSALRIDSIQNVHIDTGQFQLTDQSAAFPALSFNSDPDTGLYRVGANEIAISCGGSQKLDINTTTAYFSVNPLPYADNALDFGGPSAAWGNVWGYIFHAKNGTGNNFQSGDGSASSPAYAFSNSNNIGMYRVAGGTLGFAGGGVEAARTDNSNWQFALPVKFPNGSVSVPSISFTNNTDTGFFYDSSSSGTVYLAINGVAPFSFYNSTAVLGNAVATGNLTLSDSSNQITIGGAVNKIILNATVPGSGSRTYGIADLGGNGNVILASSGTANRMTKFTTAGTAIGNSGITDTGIQITMDYRWGVTDDFSSAADYVDIIANSTGGQGTSHKQFTKDNTFGSAQAILPASGNGGYFVRVRGNTYSTPMRSFIDMLLFATDADGGASTVTVMASANSNSPTARTYTISGGFLNLLLSGNSTTYGVSVFALQ